MNEVQFNIITVAVIANAIFVILATLMGPIIAVWITRKIDAERARTTRKLDVFRAMMRNRRMHLSPDYVNAFNLIEVEFQGVEPVERAFKDVFNHMSASVSQPDWFDKFRRLTTRLLYAMGKNLGYEMEQLDVLEGGYNPTAFGQLEEEQATFRRLLIEVLQGKRSLPVHQGPPIIPLQNDSSRPPQESAPPSVGT
ncbi:DUF6680 family protein [Rhodopseudomonas sp. B29]|uniref:DUF6680 family protein n=1 Tax=Rhodopseudomonas sp. B29 TaxID=95607 RepID=UPI0003B518D4|nr:DUF6680 family protein [Rhodopseudomonas sp. B29]